MERGGSTEAAQPTPFSSRALLRAGDSSSNPNREGDLPRVGHTGALTEDRWLQVQDTGARLLAWLEVVATVGAEAAMELPLALGEEGLGHPRLLLQREGGTGLPCFFQCSRAVHRVEV